MGLFATDVYSLADLRRLAQASALRRMARLQTSHRSNSRNVMPKRQTARDLLDRFEKECRNRFKFLEEGFDFEPPKRQRISVFCSLTYQNETTAVEVSLEPIDGGVFVLVSRLVNGQIPKYPVFVTRGMKLHSFYLDDLVGLRRPDAAKRQAGVDPPSVREIAKSVGQSASQLRELGNDILSGDFAIFSELDKIVKARIPSRNRS